MFLAGWLLSIVSFTMWHEGKQVQNSEVLSNRPWKNHKSFPSCLNGLCLPKSQRIELLLPLLLSNDIRTGPHLSFCRDPKTAKIFRCSRSAFPWITIQGSGCFATFSICNFYRIHLSRTHLSNMDSTCSQRPLTPAMYKTLLPPSSPL